MRKKVPNNIIKFKLCNDFRTDDYINNNLNKQITDNKSEL